MRNETMAVADRFEEQAIQLLPCDHGGSDALHEIINCPYHLRPAVAEALREADREGAKRARREALEEAAQQACYLCREHPGYFDHAHDNAAQLIRALAAKEEEAPAVGHTYVSTACFHKLHTDCREACKWCAKLCLCICHQTVEEEEAP